MSTDRSLSGRTLDLKSAYKQLASKPSDAWAAILGIWDPERNEMIYYRFTTLPFGSSHSVTAFNRTASAIRKIMIRLTKLVVTNFYDDYCQIEKDALVNSALVTANLILKLLGWKVAEDAHKALPFRKVFDLLGASVILHKSAEGTIEIGNKEGRAEALEDLIEGFCKREQLHHSELAKLRGKLMYAASHTFGRTAMCAVRILNRHISQGKSTALQEADILLLRETLRMIRETPARQVQAIFDSRPVIIFTDGACEDNGTMVTHGAVIYDPAHRIKRFFGEIIPEKIIAAWSKEGKRQLVGQAEMLPVLVSKVLWGPIIHKRHVLWFMDNDSARAAFGSCTSKVDSSFNMLCISARIDAMLGAYHWYTRVPSCANISDPASRLDFAYYDHSHERDIIRWENDDMNHLLNACST